ncbi:MAG: DUF616 domain-containing protein [Lachnospiraceae bacterium]|nr:DUF616 domain-containing protein [Lachnospiraceae bacterium]
MKSIVRFIREKTKNRTVGELIDLLIRKALQIIEYVFLTEIHTESIISKECKSKIDNGEDYNFNAVVYTCISDGYEPGIDKMESGYKCVLFTNMKSISCDGWHKVITQKKMHGSALNRFYKTHPHIFGKYDYALYIDGNVRIEGNINEIFSQVKQSKCGIAIHSHPKRKSVYKEALACLLFRRGHAGAIIRQMIEYKKEGFPRGFGLFENTVIATDLTNPISKKIMDDWWKEYVRSKSGRDQLSLPYVLWKNGYTKDDVAILGNDIHKNPVFRVAYNRKHRG